MKCCAITTMCVLSLAFSARRAVASTLLAEFSNFTSSFTYQTRDTVLPTTITFTFGFEQLPVQSPDTQEFWSIDTTAADLGNTFVADAATTAAFNSLLTSSLSLEAVPIAIKTSDGFSTPPPWEFPVSQLFTGGFTNGSSHAQADVPQLGPNFSGYHIDRVEETIVDWSITRNQNSTFNLVKGTNTVRIYGYFVGVPEPSSCLLFGAGGCSLLLWRHRRVAKSVRQN
jgi:hypothetical protein